MSDFTCFTNHQDRLPLFGSICEVFSKTGIIDDTLMFLKAMTVKKVPSFAIYLYVLKLILRLEEVAKLKIFLRNVQDLLGTK